MRINVLDSGLVLVYGYKGNLPYLIESKKGFHYTSMHWVSSLLVDTPEAQLDPQSEANWYKLRDRQVAIWESFYEDTPNAEDIFKKLFAFPLWAIQKRAAKAMVFSHKFYLADDVGLGKTLSALAALVYLKEIKKIKRAVVVTTASLKYQWLMEVTRAIRGKFKSDYSVCVIDGTKKKRASQYEQDAFLYIGNYETLRVDAVKGSPFANPPEAVVFDEAWKLKNSRSLTSKVLKREFRDTPYKYALNASPMGNGYRDLFGVFDIVDPLIFMNWKTFRSRYVCEKTLFLKNRRVRVFDDSRVRNIDELKGKVKYSLLRRIGSDCVSEVPRVQVVPYWITLAGKQRATYNRVRHDKRLNPLARSVKARTCCLYTGDVAPGSSPKFQGLVEILKEVVPDSKVLVFCESRKFLEAVLPSLKSRKISAALIVGGLTSKKKEERSRAFTEGNVRCLLMTSAGESGLNLQASDTVVNLDLPWNSERLRQRVGRLRPSLGGSKRKIRVINLLARGTIEERVVEVILRKVGNFSTFFNEPQIDLTGVLDDVKFLSEAV